MAMPIPGVPFSAQQFATRIRTRADGTADKSSEVTQIARDSAGRIRETMNLAVTDASAQPFVIKILDSVAHVAYVLEPATRIAHRLQMPMGPSVGFPIGLPSFRANDGSFKSPKGRPERKSEDLGTQTFEGVDAKGTRLTLIYSAASQAEPKDRVIVNETWLARELGLTLMITKSDTSWDTDSATLTNIKREEPDPSLFVVPADYQIAEMPLQ